MTRMKTILAVLAAALSIGLAAPAAEAHVLTKAEAASALYGSPGDNDAYSLQLRIETYHHVALAYSYIEGQWRNGDHEVQSLVTYVRTDGRIYISRWFNSWQLPGGSHIYDGEM